MDVEYEFKVIVDYCKVNDYFAVKKTQDISYNIGGPDLSNVGLYIFVEDTDCDYSQTVILTNLPDFITHNKDTNDFTLPKTSNLDFIGSYTVTIRSEIQTPDDPSGTTFTTLFVEYDFIIYVEPCLVNTYTATTEAANIFYDIGGADRINVSPYVFDEDPVCNYSETVTVSNLPTFVTHNAPFSDDFTLPKNTDLFLLGAYTVTVRSEIQVPDDYTKTTFTTMFDEHDFVIYMEPCIVDVYEAAKKVTKIVYNINQPDLTAGHYIFDEDPICNYPETVRVTDLPAFAIHNEASSDFTIPQNPDLGLIGSYVVKLRSEIQIPDDYTGATFTTKFVEYDFTIQVEECIVSTYTAD